VLAGWARHGRMPQFRTSTPELGERLVGGMPFGLFKGVRTYTLAVDKSGGTLFTMREEYTGPMAASIGRSILDLNPSFQQFASGRGARVESSS
jgi:hypothetical protein